jgi:predicted murein hydrolase (TIGR00659 family)
VKPDLHSIWVYLAASPLLWLTGTLVAYQGAMALYEKAGRRAFLNPVMVAIVSVVTVLEVTGTDYYTYFDGAQFVHFLLGPATVALAVPLYRQLSAVRRSAGAVAAALLTGSATAVVTAVGIAWALGATREIVVSLAPKSVTTPIAMAVAERIGGLPSLTAVMVMLTGISGAAMGPWLLECVGVRDPRAQGLAMGTASHGIAVARSLQISEVAGAFAGLAMGLNGIATAVLVPLLASLLR